MSVLTRRIVGLVGGEELACLARDDRAVWPRDGAVVGRVESREHAPHEDLLVDNRSSFCEAGYAARSGAELNGLGCAPGFI